MSDEWSKDQAGVAHHEAGHRVCASIERAPAKPIMLRWNKTDVAWEGEVPGFSRSELAIEALIRIAFAGPWAEIKYAARCRLAPNAQFDETDEPTALISYIQLEDEDKEVPDPLDVSFVYGCGQRSPFPIDINAFSFDDEHAVKLAAGNKGLIKQLLLSTRNQLNEMPVWSAIEALAKEIQRRMSPGDEVNLPAEDAEALAQAFLHNLHQ